MTPSPQSRTEELLRSLVAARLNIRPAAVLMDVPIVAELGLDSIEIMQFLLEVEDRFPGLQLDDPMASGPRTLRELASLLEEFPRRVS